MANSRSARKRIRTNERKHFRNQMYRSRVKTLIKKSEQSIYDGKLDEAALYAALQALDKAAGKGILHKNNVARRKSRLMKKLSQLRQPAGV